MMLSLDTCRCNDGKCIRAGSCARYMDRPNAPVSQVASFRTGSLCSRFIHYLPPDRDEAEERYADRQREQRARNDEGGR